MTSQSGIHLLSPLSALQRPSISHLAKKMHTSNINDNATHQLNTPPEHSSAEKGENQENAHSSQQQEEKNEKKT